MKFLWSNLWTGGLSTDDDDDDNDNDANDDTLWTIHDCIGPSAISKWAKKINGNNGTVISLKLKWIWPDICVCLVILDSLSSWS